MGVRRGLVYSCSEEVGFWVVWKAIQRWWPLAQRKLSFVVSNEQIIKFWKNAWFGTSPLYISYPNLYALTTSRRLGWRINAEVLGLEEDEILSSPHLSMIEKWRRRRGSCVILGDWFWRKRLQTWCDHEKGGDFICEVQVQDPPFKSP